MNETKRFKLLLKEHFDGSPWLDVNIIDTLKNIKAEDASKKIGNYNSIYQIVIHLTMWRIALLKKLKGEKIIVPPNNFVEEKSFVTKKDWESALNKLKSSQKEIVLFLSDSKDDEFDKEISSGHSFYDLVQAILLHDTYHMGQIVLLKKLICF